MEEQTHPILKVGLKVLEDWAMMLVDPAEGRTEIFELGEPLYRSQIEMHGAFNGKISIVAQKDFIHDLAGNLLGSNDPSALSDEECTDAFREMGNVLAGNFITEAYGADVAFDILNPRVDKMSEQELQAISECPQAYFLRADDKPLCISFEISEKK